MTVGPLPDFRKEWRQHAHALLVGIDKYARVKTGWKARDAWELFNVLVDRERAGYDPAKVTLLENQQATRDAMLIALQSLGSRTTDQDTVLVYFSGFSQRQPDGIHYLLPYETEEKDPSLFGISNEEFWRLLSQVKAKNVAIIIDSIGAGGFIENLKEKRNLVLIGSARPDEMAYVDMDAPTSFFTKYLIEGLSGGLSSTDEYLRIVDLFNYIGPLVTQASPRQHPLMRGSFEYNFPVALYMGGQVDALHTAGQSNIPDVPSKTLQKSETPPPQPAVRQSEQIDQFRKRLESETIWSDVVRGHFTEQIQNAQSLLSAGRLADSERALYQLEQEWAQYQKAIPEWNQLAGLKSALLKTTESLPANSPVVKRFKEALVSTAVDQMGTNFEPLALKEPPALWAQIEQYQNAWDQIQALRSIPNIADPEAAVTLIEHYQQQLDNEFAQAPDGLQHFLISIAQDFASQTRQPPSPPPLSQGERGVKEGNQNKTTPTPRRKKAPVTTTIKAEHTRPARVWLVVGREDDPIGQWDQRFARWRPGSAQTPIPWNRVTKRPDLTHLENSRQGDLVLAYVSSDKGSYITGLARISGNPIPYENRWMAPIELVHKLRQIITLKLLKAAAPSREQVHKARPAFSAVTDAEWAVIREMIRQSEPELDDLLPPAPVRVAAAGLVVETPGLVQGQPGSLALELTNRCSYTWEETNLVNLLLEFWPQGSGTKTPSRRKPARAIPLAVEIKQPTPPGAVIPLELKLDEAPAAGSYRVSCQGSYKNEKIELSPAEFTVNVARPAQAGDEQVRKIIYTQGEAQIHKFRRTQRARLKNNTAWLQAVENSCNVLKQELEIQVEQEPSTAQDWLEKAIAAERANLDGEMETLKKDSGGPVPPPPPPPVIWQGIPEPPPAAERLTIILKSKEAELRLANQEGTRYRSPLERKRLLSLPPLETQDTPLEYGKRLFDLLIHTGRVAGIDNPSTDDGWRDAAEAAASRASHNFRIQLEIDDPRLEAMPWEYLATRRDKPLAVYGSSPFYRRLGSSELAPAIAEPLSIVFAVANPINLGQPRLSEDPLVRAQLQELPPMTLSKKQIDTVLQGAAAAGSIKYHFIENQPVTWAAISTAIQVHGAHVLHLMAHGLYIEDENEQKEFCLLLEDEQRGYALLPAGEIEDTLTDQGLRLVVLGSCHSGELGLRRSQQPAFAAALIKKGIPAVIAMQSSIPIPALQLFCARFYDDLARTGYIEVATATARQELFKAGEDDWAWGMPVLLMSQDEGRLFLVKQTKTKDLPRPSSEKLRQGLPPAGEELSDETTQRWRESQLSRQAANLGLPAPVVIAALRDLMAEAAQPQAAEPDQLAPKQDRQELDKLAAVMKIDPGALRDYVQKEYRLKLDPRTYAAHRLQPERGQAHYPDRRAGYREDQPGAGHLPLRSTPSGR